MSRGRRARRSRRGRRRRSGPGCAWRHRLRLHPSRDGAGEPKTVSGVGKPGAASGGAAAVTQATAPNRLASSRAWGETSTAITRAPAAAAIITADRPTPPQPCTATHSSGCTRPTAVTARNAVAKRQPRLAAVVKVISSGSATRFVSALSIATYSAKEPQWVNPGWVWRSQTCWFPDAHAAHDPQAQTKGTVTRSPGRHGPTPAPTDSTTPASSCPGTCGRVGCPRRAPASRASRSGTARSPPPGSPRRRATARGRAPPGPPDRPRTRRRSPLASAAHSFKSLDFTDSAVLAASPALPHRRRAWHLRHLRCLRHPWSPPYTRRGRDRQRISVYVVTCLVG